MTRREHRISTIKDKIAVLDRMIKQEPVRNARYQKLCDRRDSWEERLVLAEIGPLKVYSKAE
jgi:hypothetical protein